MSARHKLIYPLILLAIMSSIVVINTIMAKENSTVFLPYVIRISTSEPPPLPPPDRVRLTQYGDRGFDCTVTDIANAGDGRLFVVLQDGRIELIDETGHVLDEPFLDLSWVPNPCRGDTDNDEEQDNWELGLLGLAFHPDYHTNGQFFVTYNDPETYRIRLARYTVSDGNPNVANPASKEILLSVQKSKNSLYANGRSPVHNGGDISFGSDGYLYVGFGDGGTDPDRFGNAIIDKPADPIPGDLDNDSQNLNNLLGSIIRIDVNSNSTGNINPDCGDIGYSIPSDNPFAGVGSACGEIWSYGWRNPWRFSFDPFTGDMYVGDVGEWERDEISVDEAGSGGGGNFGWNCYEGDFDHSQADHVADHCNGVSTIPPLYSYKGAWPGEAAMSVNGGFVYRGRDVIGLRGYYVFGDFLDGRNLWRLRKDHIDEGITRMEITNKHELPGQFAQSRTLSWTTFGEDVDGELYVGEWYGFGNNTTGTYIYKIENE